jgi:hypothetical protein
VVAIDAFLTDREAELLGLATMPGSRSARTSRSSFPTAD